MADMDVDPPAPRAGHGKENRGRAAPKAGAAGAAAAAEPAGAAAGSDVVEGAMQAKMRTGEIPLEVSARVSCRFRDLDFYNVRVIERRQKGGGAALKGDPSDYEYYVHYEQFNRRMDSWVTSDSMDLATVEYDQAAAEREAAAGVGRTRHQRKRDDPPPAHGNVGHAEEGHEEFDAAQLREHEEFTKVRNILRIELGRHEMDTWYFSPFPAEYNDCSKLYFCEFTLAFFKRKEQMRRHLRKNELLHPPGDELYRADGVSMFEVDGRKEKMYCQNLCYLAKLFLDHKTLYYDVDLFLFYVLCETDERGCHIVGYFSKEKQSEEGYNLACILTLPPYQRKGYGKFLISFSYELSKKEKKVGTPERPLSDLGAVSYRSYWTRIILNLLTASRGSISIREISEQTAIKTDDIIQTLTHLNMLAYQRGAYCIVADPESVAKHLKAAGGVGVPVDPAKLIWTPYNASKAGDYGGY